MPANTVRFRAFSSWRFARDRNITVLFSAHELNQVIGALDRVLYLGNGQAALGTVVEVVTAPVLSRLYGTDIDVVRADGRIFVLSRERNVERGNHQHDDSHQQPNHDNHHHVKQKSIWVLLIHALCFLLRLSSSGRLCECEVSGTCFRSKILSGAQLALFAA